jgi:hypothetical protein
MGFVNRKPRLGQCGGIQRISSTDDAHSLRQITAVDAFRVGGIKRRGAGAWRSHTATNLFFARVGFPDTLYTSIRL